MTINGVEQYSTTAASNTDVAGVNIAEGCPAANINNAIRQVMADVKRAVGTKGSDIASASSIDLGAATGQFVDITGTTAITALGTVAAGTWRVIRFAGALTLTHNSTSLILPGGSDISTAAGDVAAFLSLGSGNWVCATYERANGLSVSAILAAINALSSTGLIARTGAGAVSARTITGTSNEVTVSNGDGVSGNPTLSLPSALTFTGKTVTGGTFSGATLSGTTTLPGSGQITSGGRLGLNTSSFASADAILSAHTGTNQNLAVRGPISLGGGVSLQSLQDDMASDAALEIYIGGAAFRVTSGSFVFASALLPSIDNSQALGSGSYRMSTIYAGTGTINTSDARQKTIRGALSEAEIAAWQSVRAKVFQWNDAVADKGAELARLHAGFIAQEVAAAFEAAGLDPARYALWCADPLFEQVTETVETQEPAYDTETALEIRLEFVDGAAVARRHSVERRIPRIQRMQVFESDGSPALDASGTPVFADMPVHRVISRDISRAAPVLDENGDQLYRLGLRMDQCMVFETAYLRSRLEAIEAALSA